MNLVYIYGPPGVGKLTVAKELTKLTGYGLFHNHLTIDCVKPVFEFGTDAFWQTVYKLRLTVIEEAARQDVSLIFTNVYEHPHDLLQAMSRFESVEGQGGRVCPVRLYCLLEELERRIQSEDRIAMGKLASVASLRKDLEILDLFTPIPGRESLSIDNTDVAPGEAARRIAEHYGLPVL